MSAQRPTTAQLRALNRVDAGEVTYAFGRWWCSAEKIQQGVYERAEQRGLVRCLSARRPDEAQRVVLTDAGRAALDAARGTRA